MKIKLHERNCLSCPLLATDYFDGSYGCPVINENMRIDRPSCLRHHECKERFGNAIYIIGESVIESIKNEELKRAVLYLLAEQGDNHER